MWKKWLALTLKISVSGFLIWFLVQQVDLTAAKERALKVAPDMLGLVILLILLQIIIANQRWRVVLDALIDLKLSFWRTQRMTYIGLFFNQALPSSVGGDAVRMAIAHRAGVPLGQAISGVFLERVANMLALVPLVVGAAPFFIDHIAVEQRLWVWVGVAVLLFLSGAGLVFLIVLQHLPEKFHRWRLVRGLIGLAGDTRRVFLSPRYAFRAIIWSVISFVNITFFIYLLARGLRLDVTLVDCLVLVPLVLLVTILPISIAGWGVREGAMIAAMGLIGVPAEGSLVLSLLIGFLSLVICLPGGIVWMMSSEKRENIASEASALETDAATTHDKIS